MCYLSLGGLCVLLLGGMYGVGELIEFDDFLVGGWRFYCWKWLCGWCCYLNGIEVLC